MRDRRGRRSMSGPSILRHSFCTDPTLVKKRWPPMSKRNPLYSTVRAMPPTCPSFSRTMGERPRRARTYAAVSPAGPPPMTTCLRSDIKTRSRRPGADEHHEDLRGIPQPLILPASAGTLHVPMLTRPFASLKIISLSFQRVRAAFPLRIALWVLAAVAAACVALWSFVPLQHGLLLTLIAAWFTLPGVVFAFFVYERQPGSGLAAAFVGPVWGYGASSIVLLALWTAGVRGPALLI